MFWIIFYLMRGTNTEKACKRMEEDVASLIKKKRKLLDIKDKVGKSPKPETLTIGRLANAYPHLVLHCANKIGLDGRALSPFTNMKWAQIGQLSCFAPVHTEILAVSYAVNCRNDILFNKEINLFYTRNKNEDDIPSNIHSIYYPYRLKYI